MREVFLDDTWHNIERHTPPWPVLCIIPGREHSTNLRGGWSHFMIIHDLGIGIGWKVWIIFKYSPRYTQMLSSTFMILPILLTLSTYPTYYLLLVSTSNLIVDSSSRIQANELLYVKVWFQLTRKARGQLGTDVIYNLQIAEPWWCTGVWTSRMKRDSILSLKIGTGLSINSFWFYVAFNCVLCTLYYALYGKITL